ncbi:hypothetical protein HPP92_015198 [Vanilla planifolia]|uniref:Guanylyl cyclase n=1 Tax=Vanilla planifolia TaxID=51239 RepID=A0A835QLV7_VANPL|nr:hypothetical protein HPP92_015198 [Vanilla planifolia]
MRKKSTHFVGPKTRQSGVKKGSASSIRTFRFDLVSRIVCRRVSSSLPLKEGRRNRSQNSFVLRQLRSRVPRIVETEVDYCVFLWRTVWIGEVPHVRQQFHWDCGLACVLMVLRTLGKWDCKIHDLMELSCSTSVWTVDLAYLLKRFSVSFRFFTIMMGANPNFSSEIFYMEQLQNDQWRVNRLFEKALEAGVSIECRSFSGEEIAALICSGDCIAVVLVDKFKLSQSQQRDGCISVGSSDYMGHYVVVCGYDADTNEFEIRDPASSRINERVSLECLDCARKCFGTDEDIILVSLNGMPLELKYVK